MFQADPVVHPDDNVVACPICGSDKPASSFRLLRSVVKRKGRYVGIVNGELLECSECGSAWAYSYTQGVFTKRQKHAEEPAKAQTQPEAAKPPKATRMWPKPRPSI